VRPGRARVDREAGGAIAGHALAAGLFERIARTGQIGGKARGIEREHAGMVPAVAGDLVPGLRDARDQARVALRHPAEREERGLDPCPVKQRQNRLDIAFDARFQPIPVGAVDHALESADLKPLLDIDGQAVQHGLGRYNRHDNKSPSGRPDNGQTGQQAGERKERSGSALGAVALEPFDQHGQDVADRLFLFGQTALKMADPRGRGVERAFEGLTTGLCRLSCLFLCFRIVCRGGGLLRLRRAHVGQFDHGLLQFGDLLVAAAQGRLDSLHVERGLTLRAAFFGVEAVDRQAKGLRTGAGALAAGAPS
jgi:hypothetical protein